MRFVAKKREERIIEVEFPSGNKKSFALVGRTIKTQIELPTLIKRMQSVDTTDPKQSEKALDEVFRFMFPGHSLKDFEELDMEDIVGLMESIRTYLESSIEVTADEKKNQSSQPT